MNFEEYPEEFRKGVASKVLMALEPLQPPERISVLARVISDLAAGEPYWWRRDAVQYIATQGKISYIKILIDNKLPTEGIRGDAARIYEEIEQLLIPPETLVFQVQES